MMHQDCFWNRHRKAVSGVSLTEYGILAGLIALMSVAGLQLLGGATSTLFGAHSQNLTANTPLKLLATPSASKVATSDGSSIVMLQGSGYYSIGVDPATGQPMLQLVNGAEGVATNVSSIDGGRMNTLGTMMMAQSLADLAEQQTDPVLKDYYTKMARAAFYLGGAEGELDDVPGLGFDPPAYTNGNALRDVYLYSQTLQGLLKNPPSQLNSQNFNEVMPLGANVYNIAKNYLNTLSQFISPNGTVVGFANKDGNSGNGSPGSILAESTLHETSTPVLSNQYEDLQNYTTLKKVAAGVLADNKVSNVPVKSTLANATTIDQKAESIPVQPSAPSTQTSTTLEQPTSSPTGST